MEQSLQNRLCSLLPCQVKGQISWILNRTEYGWVLGLFNNEGVDRSQEKGDVFIHEADVIARILAPGCRIEVLSSNQNSLRFDGENWCCDIPSEQMILLNLLKTALSCMEFSAANRGDLVQGHQDGFIASQGIRWPGLF